MCIRNVNRTRLYLRHGEDIVTRLNLRQVKNGRGEDLDSLLNLRHAKASATRRYVEIDVTEMFFIDSAYVRSVFATTICEEF